MSEVKAGVFVRRRVCASEALCVLTLFLGLALAPQAAVASESLGLLELFRYHEYSDRLASSGQPTPEQLPALAAAGIDAVISLVPLGEPGTYADEGEQVRALGMDFVHIPVDWEAPPPADLRRFFAAMARFKHKRVLVHCYANARASAFVYLWRVLEAGHEATAARETMLSIWRMNEGYAFETVPQWTRFVAEAIAASRGGANGS